MRTIDEVLNWYVYKPHGWGHTFAKDKCSFSVHNTGRSVGFHQCSFSPKETIAGHGFCKKHAVIIRDSLIRAESRESPEGN